MKTLTKLGIAAGLISLLGCGPRLEEGYVCNMRYEPANTTTTLMPMIVGKTTILVPYTIYDDEDYIITICGELNGKELSTDYYVDRETFQNTNIDDYFTAKSSHELEDIAIKTRQ